jgi:hypothetical protein
MARQTLDAHPGQVAGQGVQIVSDPLAAARRTIENAAKATDPPWIITKQRYQDGSYTTQLGNKLRNVISSNNRYFGSTPPSEEDGTFIMDVRTDAPLVSQAYIDATEEIGRLKARIKELEADNLLPMSFNKQMPPD